MLSLLGADWPAKIILERKAEPPNWGGTDVIAVFHTRSRPLLTHPDIRRS
jgi:hypothetical protein